MVVVCQQGMTRWVVCICSSSRRVIRNEQPSDEDRPPDEFRGGGKARRDETGHGVMAVNTVDSKTDGEFIGVLVTCTGVQRTSTVLRVTMYKY